MLTTRYILDEAHLKHYDERLKSWASSPPVKTIPSSLYPWTLTEKAGAVTCWPVGGTELKPTVDFVFTETGPASGDKGPDNPSTIIGVSQAKIGRCGKNLFNVHGTLFQTSPFTITDDDFLELSRTNNTDAQQYSAHLIVPSPSIQSNETYTLVVEIKEISNCNVLFNMGDSYGQRGQLNTGYVLYSTVGTYFKICTNNNLYNPNCILRAMISANPGNSYSVKVRFSIIEGIVDSSNFEYVPYSGNDYTLPLGNTYYGGTLDVASGVMTVTHACVRSTVGGSLSDGISDGLAHCYLKPGIKIKSDNTQLCCNRFLTSTTNGAERVSCRTNGFTSLNCYIDKTRLDFSSAEDPDNPTNSEIKTAFDAWLVDNPVDVIFELYEPYNVQLTPTQILSLTQTDKYTPRLNTVYTDASAVQVGYVKSTIREEYELTQAIVAQGGNI